MRNFFRLIRTGFIIAILGAGIGAVVASILPTSYNSSLSFTVNSSNKQDTTAYQYDGYYAIQAADLFSDTIVSWFQTPSFLLEVYKRAGVDPEIKTLDSFTGRFKMRKFSSQNLVLKFSMASEDTAKKLSEAILREVEDRSKQLNNNAKQQALFDVRGSEPVIVKNDPTPAKGAFFGLIGALIAYVFVMSMISAFRKTEKQ